MQRVYRKMVDERMQMTAKCYKIMPDSRKGEWEENESNHSKSAVGNIAGIR